MNSRRVLIALVMVNLLCLAFQFAHGRPGQPDNVAPIVRAQALEIVDDHGRVRAELKVFPAQPNFKMPDGTTGYPETVLLRLITSKGAPTVKIAATEDGSAAGFRGDSDPTDVQILARGATTSVKLVNQNGREQVIKPQ